MNWKKWVLTSLLATLLTACAKETTRPSTASPSGQNTSQSSSTPSSTISSTPSSTPNDALTTDRAQGAIDRFMDANNFTGSMTIRGGIREIPADNSATADLSMSSLSNGGNICPGNCGGWSAGGEWSSGKAVFSRFNDGKWELSQVSITHSGHGQTRTFKTANEVR